MAARRTWAGFGLAVGLAVACLGAAAVAYLLFAGSPAGQEADRANVREWLDEARVFRKSLPDLVREYADFRGRQNLPPEDQRVEEKRQEIAEQLKRLTDPTRTYTGLLPLFPELYAIEVSFPDRDWLTIAWESPVPRPRPGGSLAELSYAVTDGGVRVGQVRCEYRLHAYNQRQREAETARRRNAAAVGAALVVGLLAAAGAAALVQREQTRERRRLEAEQARDAAERTALELRSQMYASIGVMAGSYAHNIKNLLVRPNDLLARCLDATGLPDRQKAMLGEVRDTLATVTERLQQILKTVRRDPTQAAAEAVDVAALVRDLHRTWADLAKEKWKVELTLDAPAEPLWVTGDGSNLQQAAENLVFNARDATFEMRNRLREAAHDPSRGDGGRRQALLDAAAWRGRVAVRVRRDGSDVALEVADNGVGMTEDVRRRCTEAHFTTKSDNALYAGYSAGMGLGLSFVASVLEAHAGRLEIDSEPGKGATFRLRLPGR